jgi:hypothetical protein
MFYSQFNQSNEQYHLFSLACAASLRKLRNLFNFNDSQNNELHFQPELIDFIRENQVDENVHLDEKFLILLPYLSKSLRKLYYCSIISSTNKIDSLFLLICLNQLHEIVGDDPIRYRALSMLKPLLIEHSLENYALTIFREHYSDIDWFIENPHLCDRFFLDQSFHWEELIHIKRQRIHQDKNFVDNKEKDLGLFSASISLARIFQGQYHSIESENILSSIENEDIYYAIINI